MFSQTHEKSGDGNTELTEGATAEVKTKVGPNYSLQCLLLACCLKPELKQGPTLKSKSTKTEVNPKVGATTVSGVFSRV